MASTSSISNSLVKVSVIIPTYNRAFLIKEAIASVLAQTNSNWELIVVDDGSTDNTVDFVRSIKDPRVHILALPHCGNIASLRNIGVENSSGNWIAFLDSDDIWISQKLAMQLGAMQKTAIQWSYGGFELINETGDRIPNKYGTYHPFSGWIIRKLITYEATANISSVMLRRSLFDKIGGFNSDPNLFCREDYEFVLRLASYAETQAISSVLVRIRDHRGRTTKTLDNGPARTANVYEHFYGICQDKGVKTLVRKQYARHLAEAAEKYLYSKKYFKACQYFARAILNRDSFFHLLSSFKRGFIRN